MIWLRIMVTVPLETLKEYNSAAEQISAYLERVTLFFTANSVVKNKQVATFLSVVGPTTYSILRNLFAPAPPSDQSLAEIFACLKRH